MASVVATDGLRIRSEPSIGQASRPLEPLAPRGLRLFVVDGPVPADGYAWYQVQPLWTSGAFDGVAGLEIADFGWVAAASREGQPWIEGLNLACPQSPSATELNGMGRYVALACYGSGSLTVTSTLACVSYDTSGGSKVDGPSWIDNRGRGCMLWPDNGVEPDGRADYSRVIGVTGDPIRSIADLPEAELARTFRITGHFDDPGSSECRLTSPDRTEPTPAEIVLFCRLQFVVSSAEPMP